MKKDTQNSKDKRSRFSIPTLNKAAPVGHVAGHGSSARGGLPLPGQEGVALVHGGETLGHHLTVHLHSLWQGDWVTSGRVMSGQDVRQDGVT